MSSRSRGSNSKKKQKIYNHGQFMSNTIGEIYNAFPGLETGAPLVNGFWWFPWTGTLEQQGKIQEGTSNFDLFKPSNSIGQAVLDPTSLQGVRQVSNIHFEMHCAPDYTQGQALIYGFQWFLMKVPEGIEYKPLFTYPGDNQYKFWHPYTEDNLFYESFCFGNAGASNGLPSMILATGLVDSNPFDGSVAQVNISGPVTLESGDVLMTCVRNVDPFGDGTITKVTEFEEEREYLSFSRVNLHDRLKFIWSINADVSY